MIYSLTDHTAMKMELPCVCGQIILTKMLRPPTGERIVSSTYGAEKTGYHMQKNETKNKDLKL